MKRVFAIFVEGLFAILPLTVTLVLIYWLGSAAERALGAGLRWALPEGWYITGMGVVAGILVIFVAGLLVNIWGVPRLIAFAEHQVGRIPLVKTVYGAVRDLLGFFSKSGGLGAPNKVVVVSLAESGIRCVGLLTREQFEDLPSGIAGPDADASVVVYIPYSYQVGGFMLLVPRRYVQPLDMNLEDAMRFIVTGGVQGAGAGRTRASALPATAPAGNAA